MRTSAAARISVATLLAIIGLLAVIGGTRPDSVSAAAFIVTKTADTNDGTCNADCSLREAVVAANALAGHDNISIPAGTYILTGTTGEDASATGDLDVTDSVSFNGSGMTTTVINGGAVDNVIHVQPSASGVIITDLTLGNGFVGVLSTSGDVDLANATVAENGLDGVITTSGNVTLASSVVAGNGFGDGGDGIVTDSGNVTITRSTINGNQDDGIHTATGNITATNSTVSGNGSDGLFSEDGDININWSTVAFNGADGAQASETGVIYLTGALMANNTDADCASDVEDSDNSMDTDGTCGLGGGEVSNGTANLGSLQANGGTTSSHALLTGSDAIDAGGTSCPEDDQRGTERYQGAACDIGAYEGVSTAPTSTPTLAATATPCTGPCPTATPTSEKIKTHTPTVTTTAAATTTAAPSTSTPLPAATATANTGGQGGDVITPPDTGSGPGGGSSGRGVLVAAMMATVVGASAIGAGRKLLR